MIVSHDTCRLDELVVSRGLAETREDAQILIRLGKVLSGTRRLEKPGIKVRRDLPLDVEPEPPYVSRGGLKLAGALEDLKIDVEGLLCLDLGISTGGFTDCLLQKGAARVIGVDVGKNVVHEKILGDPRVLFIHKNARYLTPEDIGEPVDFVTLDLSFISVARILPVIPTLIKPNGRILIMVKPQFELERRFVRKGVVTDEALIHRAVESVIERATALGFTFQGHASSRLPGPKGNREQFLLLARQ